MMALPVRHGSLFALLFLTLAATAGAQPADTLFVDADALPGGNGEAWVTAYADLQDALQFARDHPDTVAQVWVAEGTYYPTDDGDEDVSFDLVSGIALYGGFAGTEASLDERDWEAHPTVLSGDIGIPGEPEDNSLHVVRASGLSDTAVLNGFTIRDGYGDVDDRMALMGAGLYLSSSPIEISNTIITK